MSRTLLRSIAVLLTAVAMVSGGSASPVARADRQRTSRPILASLDSLDEFRKAFNRDVGVVRVVLLLSPTWPPCLAGARWVQQQLLDKHRDASLRVFAVWYAMYPGDARARWRRDLLTDDRVMHWWDERRLLGRQALVEIRPYSQLRAPGSRDFQEEVLWDAYFLFDRKARWDQSPSGLVSWGYTVMTTRATLAEQVGRLVQTEGAR